MEAPGHVPSVPSPKSGTGCQHPIIADDKYVFRLPCHVV